MVTVPMSVVFAGVGLVSWTPVASAVPVAFEMMVV